MKKLDQKSYDVTSDGRTVWVNTGEGLIGRFGLAGIDIHRPLPEQLTGGECLFCTHTFTTKEDWKLFLEKMKEYYGVEIASRHCPTRFASKISGKKSRKSS